MEVVDFIFIIYACFSLAFFLVTNGLCLMQTTADTTGAAIRQNLIFF